MLQHNLSHCPPELKEMSYKAIVRPQLEYCAAVWNPHTTRNINKIEAVQRRAARFVKNDFSRDSSVTTMLNTLKWQSLEKRRAVICLVIFYKTHYNLIDISSSLLVPSFTYRGHSQSYLIPH